VNVEFCGIFQLVFKSIFVLILPICLRLFVMIILFHNCFLKIEIQIGAVEAVET